MRHHIVDLSTPARRPRGAERALPKLRGGDILEVVLDDLPSTGYVWQTQELPDGVCDRTADRYGDRLPDPPSEPLACGAGQRTRFLFAVRDDVRAGERVVLRRARPWAQGGDDQRVVLTVA